METRASRRSAVACAFTERAASVVASTCSRRVAGDVPADRGFAETFGRVVRRARRAHDERPLAERPRRPLPGAEQPGLLGHLATSPTLYTRAPPRKDR